MTARQARNQRRAAERQANKAAAKNGTPVESISPSPVSPRAEANRQNAQLSTGPRTEAGKAKSSHNSFKHGLYSRQLVLPNEDPAELDELRATLRAEHQPANTTEEILVNELAEHFWRIRRMRKYETHALQPDKIQDWIELLPMIQRTMASAERGFHKALTALTRLQKERGFVPAKLEAKAEQPAAQAAKAGSLSHFDRNDPLGVGMSPEEVGEEQDRIFANIMASFPNRESASELSCPA